VTDIFKNAQISNFLKVRLVGAELFHADGWTDRQTDMTTLIVAVRHFSHASKISFLCRQWTPEDELQNIY